MLALPHTNSWGFRYRNPDVFSDTTPGVSVTPGASNAEGSWTEIAGDADVTTDIHYCKLMISGGTSNANSKQHLLDFGWDPAGGTSYVAWFQNLACGGSSVFAGSGQAGGQHYHFPCRIPSGSAIAVRVQGSNGTAGTVRIIGEFYGKPSRPELWRNAAYTETLGFSANTLGTSFTPGTDAFGTWASLGTTAKRHFWAQLGVQIDNNTVTSRITQVQLGIGGGAAGDTHIIAEQVLCSDTIERVTGLLAAPCTWEIASGATLWVRASCNDTPDSGYNATAVLFGG